MKEAFDFLQKKPPALKSFLRSEIGVSLIHTVGKFLSEQVAVDKACADLGKLSIPSASTIAELPSAFWVGGASSIPRSKEWLQLRKQKLSILSKAPSTFKTTHINMLTDIETAQAKAAFTLLSAAEAPCKQFLQDFIVDVYTMVEKQEFQTAGGAKLDSVHSHAQGGRIASLPQLSDLGIASVFDGFDEETGQTRYNDLNTGFDSLWSAVSAWRLPMCTGPDIVSALQFLSSSPATLQEFS